MIIKRHEFNNSLRIACRENRCLFSLRINSNYIYINTNKNSHHEVLFSFFTYFIFIRLRWGKK